MAVRRPNLLAAGMDLAFALAAGVIGALGLDVSAALGIVGAHMIYWAISRSNQPRALGVATISLMIIVAVDLGAYWLGSQIHGLSA